MITKNNLVGGWPTPLKKYEFVSWDDDIPNWMAKYKMFQTTKQVYLYLYMAMGVP